MWVSESSCDIESEVRWVFDLVVPEFDIFHTLLLESGFLENWLQYWIQFFSHIFQEQRRPKCDAVLQCSNVVGVRQFDNAQFVFTFQVFHPFISLTCAEKLRALFKRTFNKFSSTLIKVRVLGVSKIQKEQRIRIIKQETYPAGQSWEANAVS